MFGTALNQIYRYNKTLELIQSFKYTTLYSSCLFHHTDQTVIFAAGTVFGELILYEQDSNGYFHEKLNVSDHNVSVNQQKSIYTSKFYLRVQSLE